MGSDVQLNLVTLCPVERDGKKYPPCKIPRWSQADCPYGPWTHCVVIIFVGLNVGAKWATTMDVVVGSKTCHQRSGTNGRRDPVGWRDHVQPEYAKINHSNSDDVRKA